MEGGLVYIPRENVCRTLIALRDFEGYPRLVLRGLLPPA